MGVVLTAKGKTPEAIACYRQALRLRPDNFKAMNNLAWALSVHDLAERPTDIDPLELAETACRQAQYKDPWLLDTLAAAYADASRFPEAVRTAQEAIRLADVAGARSLSDEIRQRLELYRAGRPYREPPPLRTAIASEPASLH